MQGIQPSVTLLSLSIEHFHYSLMNQCFVHKLPSSGLFNRAGVSYLFRLMYYQLSFTLHRIHLKYPLICISPVSLWSHRTPGWETLENKPQYEQIMLIQNNDSRFILSFLLCVVLEMRAECVSPSPRPPIKIWGSTAVVSSVPMALSSWTTSSPTRVRHVRLPQHIRG